MDKSITPELIEYCTDRQREVIDAVLKHGTRRKAAKALGVAKNTVDHHVKQVRKQAAMKGYTAEMDLRKAIPQLTHTLGKCTVQMDMRSGEVERVWARAESDREKLAEAVRILAESACESVRPIKKISKPTHSLDQDLLANYLICDLHLGMYAWKRESGDDYDCSIAKRLLVGAMDRLIWKQPNSEEAVVANLGDYLHLTDETNQTPRGKNQLDVDTRWKRVADIGVELASSVIDMALQKHGIVHFYNIRGNHDMYVAYMLGKVLEARYANNERVRIHNDHSEYSFHRFGDNFVGLAHGHLAKPQDLGRIMMCDRPADCGECKHRYWWTGHIHHRVAECYGWYQWESFATLAAKDAHAASKYRAPRTMDGIVLHRQFGECDRSKVTVQEVLS